MKRILRYNLTITIDDERGPEVLLELVGPKKKGEPQAPRFVKEALIPAMNSLKESLINDVEGL
jgi:hypothetical protein